jgi:FKBP-type peptidyl-prolyl cis-trans isomerase FklB
MKKTVLTATAAIFALTGTVKAQEKPSVSYSLGVLIGNDLKNLPNISTINFEEVKKGLEAAAKGTPTCSIEEASKIFQASLPKEAPKADAPSETDAQAKEKTYLAENAKKAGIKATPSGLQYLVITQGKSTKKPVATSQVKVHYHGTTTDGTVFDSSVERGEPITFGLNQVIRGWTEGVQLMTVGSKYKFFIPYNLAYGAQSPSPKIAPYSTLIFEVELLDIVEAAQPANTPKGK